MAHSFKLPLIATLVLSCFAVQIARSNEPPADLCSLLPATQVSKTLGRTYEAPQKSEAPRPFANTNTGTDCNYLAKGSKLWFRIYVDPSPSAAADLFAKLSKFYGTPKKVSGLGDEAYFDEQHALHVRKGKVRFYLNLNPIDSPATAEKQLTDLANSVVAQL